jgi:hypothetical protein
VAGTAKELVLKQYPRDGEPSVVTVRMPARVTPAPEIPDAVLALAFTVTPSVPLELLVSVLLPARRTWPPQAT